MNNLEWKCVRTLSDDGMLNEMEERYGFRYPEGYKETVRKFNAGIPSRKSIELEDGIKISFERLISAKYGDPYTLLGGAADIAEEEEGILVIPFATNKFGNMFCFLYWENGAGVVGYLDYEEDSHRILADSWEEFLAMLT